MRSTRPLLLVEDNPDDALLLRQALQEVGVATLIHVPNGEKALAYLRTTANPKPAVVLLDLVLPSMNGVEFLKTMKAEESLAEIPIVVLSTSDQSRDILDSFDLCVAGYILKPPDYPALVESIRVVQDYWSLNLLPASRN